MKSFLQRRVLAASRHSLAGLYATWQSEEAFRVEAVLLTVMVPAAFWIGRSPLETAVLITSAFIVLIAELLNTGIEKAVDRISREMDALSKFAKDAGSAAVGLALVQCLIVWALVVGSRLQNP
jgi:diacylglycerol kinase (ATP)